MIRGVCVFCNATVNHLESAAWPITGWEAERLGAPGGANQVIARQRMNDGRIAHTACVRQAAERERQGIAPGQEQLI